MMTAVIVSISGQISAAGKQPQEWLEGQWNIELQVISLEPHITREAVSRAMSDGVKFLLVPQ